MKTLKIVMLILGLSTTMVACNDETEEVKPSSIEMAAPDGDGQCKGNC